MFFWKGRTGWGGATVFGNRLAQIKRFAAAGTGGRGRRAVLKNNKQLWQKQFP
jgi:hypothetical protein